MDLQLNERSFDLIELSNWEDQITYEPKSITTPTVPFDNSTNIPVNKVLESGIWTQSIIWGPNQPYRDFTQLEFNHEDDVVPEERIQSKALKYTINRH